MFKAPFSQLCIYRFFLELTAGKHPFCLLLPKSFGSFFCVPVFFLFLISHSVIFFDAMGNKRSPKNKFFISNLSASSQLPSKEWQKREWQRETKPQKGQVKSKISRDTSVLVDFVHAVSTKGVFHNYITLAKAAELACFHLSFYDANIKALQIAKASQSCTNN